MNLSSGTRLGPYEILSPIGAGGMGEVFRARDTRLERDVAIKVLPSTLAADAQFRLRLEREAKTISQLNHPHICTLHDVGHENGTHYLVMELIEGESLADRLNRGALPLDQVLRYGAQIASALDRAHRQGIVHRDLKPGNIMITRSGVKLLDFGLAKQGGALASPGTEADATRLKPVTEQGTIIGTYQYMAPEQLEGIEADARTDIFALGAVLFEMTTGKRAFEGKSRTSLIAAIVSSEPPAISQIQPLTPPALEHVIHKCLEKDPDDRWQSAQDVASELEWAGAAVPTTRRVRSRERLVWSAALIAAFAAGAWIARQFAPRAETPMYRFSIPTLTANVIGVGGSGSLSPNGKVLAFMGRDRATKKMSVWVRHLSGGAEKRVEGAEGLSLGRFTPDSKNLVLTDGKRIAQVPVDGGAPQVVHEGEGIGWPRAAADGRLLFRHRDGTFYTVSRNEGTARQVTALDKSRFEIDHLSPWLMPDGKHFLFLANRRDPKVQGFSHDIYVGSLEGKPARRIAAIPSLVQYANGYLYFVRGGTLLAAPFDQRKFEITGEPVPVVENVRYFRPTGLAGFEVASDGTIAYVPRASGSTLVWLDYDGTRLGVVGDAEHFIPSMCLSHDGTRVFVTVDDREGVARRWVYGLTRNSRTPLSTHWGWESNQVVTADGSTVYYSSDRAELPDIYMQRVDGLGDEKLVVAGPGDQFPNDISPDGKYLLYSSAGGDAGTDLMAVPLSGEAKPFVVVRTTGNDRQGRFSPDGRWIAYQSTISGRPLIYLKRFGAEGTPQEVSSTVSSLPRWSADGKYLFYLTGDGHTLMRAAILPDGTADQPRQLFTLPEVIQVYEVHPDGTRLLMMLASEENITPPINIITGWRPPEK